VYSFELTRAAAGKDSREAQDVKRFRISFDLRTVKARTQ
jgi:hypothetical protein